MIISDYFNRKNKELDQSQIEKYGDFNDIDPVLRKDVTLDEYLQKGTLKVMDRICDFMSPAQFKSFVLDRDWTYAKYCKSGVANRNLLHIMSRFLTVDEFKKKVYETRKVLDDYDELPVEERIDLFFNGMYWYIAKNWNGESDGKPDYPVLSKETIEKFLDFDYFKENYTYMVLNGNVEPEEINFYLSHLEYLNVLLQDKAFVNLESCTFHLDFDQFLFNCKEAACYHSFNYLEKQRDRDFKKITSQMEAFNKLKLTLFNSLERLGDKMEVLRVCPELLGSLSDNEEAELKLMTGIDLYHKPLKLVEQHPMYMGC